MKTISINQLHPFKNHPYKVLDNDEMNILIESVQEYGIMSPLIVRPLEGTTDQNEIISGHRRFRAAQKAGLTEVPAFIRSVSRDEAAIMLVDSNLHREHILPSEKAFAYKMKMEAMNKQGQRTDLTSAQVATKYDSAAEIGKQANESRDTVYRYIRLTYLIPELLDYVDDNRIAFSVAVALSYLSEADQYDIIDVMEVEERTPSLSQALTLKRLSQSGDLDTERIVRILSQDKPNQKEKVSFSYEEIRKYFPENYSVGDIQRYILHLIATDCNRHRDRGKGGDAR